MSDSVRPHRPQSTRFPIPGILQARTLEWVAISFSNEWKWKVKVKSLSPVQLLATPWTAAYQAPPSMGFSRWEYWSGVPLPSLEIWAVRPLLLEILFQEAAVWCSPANKGINQIKQKHGLLGAFLVVQCLRIHLAYICVSILYWSLSFWLISFEGGMFWENSIETSILSRVKQITSPGWMHETSAQGWCTGMTQRDGMGRGGRGDQDGEHM